MNVPRDTCFKILLGALFVLAAYAVLTTARFVCSVRAYDALTRNGIVCEPLHPSSDRNNSRVAFFLEAFLGDGARLAYADEVRVRVPKHAKLFSAEAPLRHVRNVYHFHGADSEVNDSHLAALRNEITLESLHLARTRVTDKGLLLVGRLPHLEQIDLSGTQITSRGLQAVCTSFRLRQVIMDHTPVGDSAGIPLSVMPCLDDVSMEGTQLTDQGLARIVAIPTLTTLNVAGCDITGRGLIGVIGSNLLTYIDVSKTDLDDSGVACLLTACPSLRFVDASETLISDAGALRLAEKVSILILRGTLVSDLAFVSLPHDAPLERLDLSNSRVTGQFGDIAATMRINHLSLSHCPVDDVGLERLAKCPELRQLDISYTKVTDSGLRCLSALSTLVELDLTGTAVTDVGLRGLRDCKSLQIIIANDTTVTDKQVQRDTEVGGLPIRVVSCCPSRQNQPRGSRKGHEVHVEESRNAN